MLNYPKTSPRRWGFYKTRSGEAARTAALTAARFLAFPVGRSNVQYFHDPIFLTDAWPEKARQSQKNRVKKLGARRLWHCLVPPGRGAIHSVAWSQHSYDSCRHRSGDLARLRVEFPRGTSIRTVHPTARSAEFTPTSRPRRAGSSRAAGRPATPPTGPIRARTPRRKFVVAAPENRSRPIGPSPARS